jgi:hypothetical protein
MTCASLNAGMMIQAAGAKSECVLSECVSMA